MDSFNVLCNNVNMPNEDDFSENNQKQNIAL